MKKTVDVTPTWMGLARIVLDDLKRSDLPTKELAMTLLTDACEALDKLNDQKLEIKFKKEDIDSDFEIAIEKDTQDINRRVSGWGGTPDHPFHYD